RPRPPSRARSPRTAAGRHARRPARATRPPGRRRRPPSPSRSTRHRSPSLSPLPEREDRSSFDPSLGRPAGAGSAPRPAGRRPRTQPRIAMAHAPPASGAIVEDQLADVRALEALEEARGPAPTDPDRAGAIAVLVDHGHVEAEPLAGAEPARPARVVV